jgi:hypothetical protein
MQHDQPASMLLERMDSPDRRADRELQHAKQIREMCPHISLRDAARLQLLVSGAWAEGYRAALSDLKGRCSIDSGRPSRGPGQYVRRQKCRSKR